MDDATEYAPAKTGEVMIDIPQILKLCMFWKLLEE